MREELPPPLPPETRTVGQLVAESIRFYGEHFWPVLALGLPLVAVNQIPPHHHQGLILLAAGTSSFFGIIYAISH